ncbi:MAG: glycosyltransferase family 9 protein [Simkaniaceae bacterium]|nr:glycosyltransferase family 9 protein [Simkaniaceae bacterium]
MKILIVKVGAIGDVVMALPTLEAARRKWPEAEITWMCGKRVAPLVRATDIDRVVEVDEYELLRKSPLEVIRAIYKAGCAEYDLVLRLHHDWRYGALTVGRGARWKPVPGRYHAYEYLRMIGAQELVWPELELPNVELEADFVLAPGGDVRTEPGKALRMWPIEKYVELDKRLQNCLILGGPKDTWLYDYFENVYLSEDLPESVALMKQAKAVVAHDSGPLHLGVLSGANVIGLFGPTMPHEKVPPGVKTLWGGENLSCRPCYDGKHYDNCLKATCMEEITVDQVIEAIG